MISFTTPVLPSRTLQLVYKKESRQANRLLFIFGKSEVRQYIQLHAVSGDLVTTSVLRSFSLIHKLGGCLSISDTVCVPVRCLCGH